MLYTFDFIDCSDQIDHFDIADYPNDREAERAARAALLRSRAAVGVTVWGTSRRMAWIMRHGWRRLRSSSEAARNSNVSGVAPGRLSTDRAPAALAPAEQLKHAPSTATQRF